MSLLTADDLADLEAEHTAELGDTCVILTPTLVDDGEGGYTLGTPTSQGPYACRYGLATTERRGDGQAIAGGVPVVALPKLTPVDLDDTIRVTVTGTGETITLSVRGFTKSSSESWRVVTGELATPQDLT